MAEQAQRIEGAGGAAGAGAHRDRSLGLLGHTPLRAPVGTYRRAWRRFRRNRTAFVALVVFGAIVAFALSADLLAAITGHDYRDGDLRSQFRPLFSSGYLLGSDANGRDLLVRLAYGGRVSLLVAGLAGGATLLIGGAVGAVAGYFGGVIDAILMRLVDVLLCLPGLALLILISTVIEAGPVGLALVLAAVGWAGVARLIRGEVLALRRRDYVEAARLVGASHGRILLRHVVPNVLPLAIVWLSLIVPSFILTEATLSFLNLGVKPPIPSWGNMLQNADEYYTRSLAVLILPGLCIYLTVLAVTLVGDGLRDALDPRLAD